MSEHTFDLKNPTVISQVATALEAALRESVPGKHDAKVEEDSMDTSLLRIRLHTNAESKVFKLLFELLPPVLAKQKEILTYDQFLLQERLELKEFGDDWQKHIKTSREARFLALYLTKYYENPWRDYGSVFVHTSEECTMYAMSDFSHVLNRDDLEKAINTFAAVLASPKAELLVLNFSDLGESM